MTGSDAARPAFMGADVDHCDASAARFHVIPAPFERSVSYGGGTRLGPSAIIEASEQVELWDGRSRPVDAGIFTREPVDCEGAPDSVMERVATVTREIAALGKVPVGLGGEHTVTYGFVKGLVEAEAEGRDSGDSGGLGGLGVVQIDAHADLRDAYEGNPFSHASVMRRIVELGVPLLQLGTRAYCEEEIEARKEYGVLYRDADVLVPDDVREIVLPDDFPARVYFTVDVDGLDPSVFPATGTPVPGGLGWYQTLALFESVARQRTIVGFDLMEFAPIDGFHAYDFAAAQLVYKLMGIVQRSRPGL